jgi:hypothetical protein
MQWATDPELLLDTRLWRSQTETSRCGLYLLYNEERSFLPLTVTGDADEYGWPYISGAHHDTWSRLTAEQQQALRDRAKALVVVERLSA